MSDAASHARAPLPSQSYYAVTARLANLQQVTATNVVAANGNFTSDLQAPQLRLGANSVVLTPDHINFINNAMQRIDVLEASVRRVAVLESALRTALDYISILGAGALVFDSQGRGVDAPQASDLLDVSRSAPPMPVVPLHQAARSSSTGTRSRSGSQSHEGQGVGHSGMHSGSNHGHNHSQANAIAAALAALPPTTVPAPFSAQSHAAMQQHQQQHAQYQYPHK